MSDAREIIADVLYEWDESAGPVPDEIAAWADRQTDRIVDALRSAGLLVEPGGETRTEHRRTGPGECACGFNTYRLGIIMADHRQLLMDHLTTAERSGR